MTLETVLYAPEAYTTEGRDKGTTMAVSTLGSLLPLCHRF
jgi:hypothetical protein